MDPTASSTHEDKRLEALFDALLYSVSHDLRSPLLTISLSAELLSEQLRDGDPDAASSGPAAALDGMRQGAADLERMLQALTALSRARRRPLEGAGARVQMLLGGHVVRSDKPHLEQQVVAVDPLVVRELLDVVAGESTAELSAAVEGAFVVLRAPLPQSPGVSGSPLGALVESLQRHAGTMVETLAVAEMLLVRQGAALTLEGDAMVARLPLQGAQDRS